MARVNIELGGRALLVECEDGQQGRLREVVAFVDSRMRSVASGCPHVRDSQLQALTLLMMADQIFDLQAELTRMRSLGQKIADQLEKSENKISYAQKAEKEALARVKEIERKVKADAKAAAKAQKNKSNQGAEDDSDGASRVAVKTVDGEDKGSSGVVTQIIEVQELDPAVEERYARIIESLVERIDSVASRMSRV